MRAPQAVQNLVPSVVGAGEGLLASPSAAVPPVLLLFLRLRRTTKMISPMITMKGNAIIERPSMSIGVDSDVDSVVADVDSEDVDVVTEIVKCDALREPIGLPALSLIVL